MDITDRVESGSYDSQINGFPISYILNAWDWKRLLMPTLTIKKYNWKCKACGTKILDDVQIITHEGHRPSYHVSCWRVLYERALEGITRHNENMFRQIDEVELTPCHIVTDAQNE